VNRASNPALPGVGARAPTPSLRLVFDVFKLRIGLAIALTALAGLAITPGPSPSAWQICALLLSVALASAAAGAFNQMYERDLDRRMRRTEQRAFVTGRLRAGPLWMAAILLIGACGIAVAALALNVWSAAYTLAGALVYGLVYTRWLKRRTRWNIVIGGLAGSFAVLAGGAAVAPSQWVPVTICYALVLFLWTPPHFWSLAIAYHEDYRAAGVPMLPVVVGDARAARAVFAGTVLLVASALAPAFLGLGLVYAGTATIAGAYLVIKSAQLLRTPDRSHAMACFGASLVYLAVLTGAAIADAAVRASLR
jgi:protoheme IX farnesyltransferase